MDRVVDIAGASVRIEFGKTRCSKRTLEVPALLQPYLLALAKGRAPDAQLISRTTSQRSGKKRDRYWLGHHVERLCAEAGVPVVCTQSQRGLHASVATEAGATSHVVASALGHSSPAVTHAHYIDGATARRVRTQRVVGTIAPGPTLRAAGNEPATRAPRKATKRASTKTAEPQSAAVHSNGASVKATGAVLPVASNEASVASTGSMLPAGSNEASVEPTRSMVPTLTNTPTTAATAAGTASIGNVQ